MDEGGNINAEGTPSLSEGLIVWFGFVVELVMLFDISTKTYWLNYVG